MIYSVAEQYAGEKAYAELLKDFCSALGYGKDKSGKLLVGCKKKKIKKKPQQK